MSGSTEPLACYKPPEWERFERLAEEEHPGRASATGIFFESSWADFNRDSEAEQVLDRLLQGEGVPSREKDEKKKILTREAGHTGKQIWDKVSVTVKEEVKAAASEYGVEMYEVVRAVVLHALDGGTLSRLAKKTKRLESELASDDSTDSLSKSERITQQICEDLPEVFTEERLIVAIEEHGGSSDYYHDRYSEAALEQLDVKRYDRGDTSLFMPPVQWQGKILGDVIEHLGGDPVEDTCPVFSHQEMVDAVGHQGVEISEENKNQVQELVDALIDRLGFVYVEERDEYVPSEQAPDESDTSSDTTNDSEPDTEPMNQSEASREELKAEVDEEFAALRQAEPKPMATDGGREVIQNDE